MGQKEPTQKTKPVKGEPITTPVPTTRDESDAATPKVTRPAAAKPTKKLRKAKPDDSAAARQRARARSGQDD
jgi:hypothetical protein